MIVIACINALLFNKCANLKREKKLLKEQNNEGAKHKEFINV